MDPNPYASPQAPLESPAPADAGPPLYTTRSVLLATFLGSFLGGGILMAINFRRLGRPGGVWAALVGGALATAGLMALSIALPDNVPIPNMVFIIAQLAAMYGVMRVAQPETERLIAAGNPAASQWRAAGWGLLVLLVLAAGVLGWMWFTYGTVGG